MEDFGYDLVPEPTMSVASELEILHHLRHRLMDILGHYLRATDKDLTDRDLALRIFRRFKDNIGETPGDPNG